MRERRHREAARTSALEQEIASKPEVIARLLDREAPRVERLVGRLADFNYILIAGRGSSDHAATYAQYVWSVLTGRLVALAIPSLYTLYNAPPRLDGALVVGISQSGQSPDIVAVLQDARRQGRPTLAITNDPASPLAAADEVIELHAGPERSIAATKTYTAQLAAIALLATAWCGGGERLAELRRLPEAVAANLAGTGEVAARAERYRSMERCVAIGRGYNYGTASELALKLEELTYILASAYSSADFRHGPIATVEEGFPVVLVMPAGAAFDDMLDLGRDLQRRGAELLVITDAAAAHSLAATVLPLAAPVPEWLSPITAIIPGQVLALHLTLARGLNPDVPRGLRKVTRTL